MKNKKFTYYNEFEPYAAQWLRNLISKGHLPEGIVDDRDLRSVDKSDLKEFSHCHFFAGIGGWALAVKLANWPIELELWTGSAPCQPFSTNGKKKGMNDDRDLWPNFFELIEQSKPRNVMGEQVAAAIGKNWLDRTFDDLEGINYSCGAVIVPACSVNSPQRRDRLWFVATSDTFDGMHETERSWGNVRHLENGNWQTYERIKTSDGRHFRNKPELSYVAHGLPARVGRLRAYGNAIVPQVAKEILISVLECRP